HPPFDRLERPGRNSIGSDPAGLPRTRETASLEHFEVLEKRGQRHVERLGELAHGSSAPSEARKDRAPGRVSQGLKDAIELRGSVRHIPKYIGRKHIGQYLSIDRARSRACGMSDRNIPHHIRTESRASTHAWPACGMSPERTRLFVLSGCGV